MPVYLEYLLAFLLIAGGIFAVIGSYGLAKLNDFYMRLHGPTKATTLGLGCILLASSIYFSYTQSIVSLHEVLITVFLFITAPVSAHLLSKTALAEGIHYTSEQDNPLMHPLNVGTQQTHDRTGVDDLGDDTTEAYRREREIEEAEIMEAAQREHDERESAASDVDDDAEDEAPHEETSNGEEADEEAVEDEGADDDESDEAVESDVADADDTPEEPAEPADDSEAEEAEDEVAENDSDKAEEAEDEVAENDSDEAESADESTEDDESDDSKPA
jgi:multicomponent K+:H+ antiporter subunit G